MMNLLPNEHHDYRFPDAIRGLFAAMARESQASLRAIRIPDLGDCLPARSGRAAIVVALQALALPPGARIGVPLYCCPVVFKAIKAAGCVPRFLDVDPGTYCLSVTDLSAKRSEVDAVIAVHMFGNVCDMPRLRDAAPGRPFIEDCAQSLGSRLNDRPVGSFADVAVFSFRLGKYLSVGEGAAVWSNQADLQSRLAECIAGLPAASRTEEGMHVLKTWLRSLLRTRPFWGLAGVRLWKLYNQKVNYASKSPLVMARIYKPDRATTLRRLAFLDSWIQRQRSHADFYSRNLAVEPARLCAERPGMFYNRLQYPLLMPDADQCGQLAACLFEDQISTARPYKEIAAIAAEHYGYTGDCPQAERVARTVIVIPCHHALKQREVERVAASVNRAWATMTGSRPAPSVPPSPLAASQTATHRQAD